MIGFVEFNVTVRILMGTVWFVFPSEIIVQRISSPIDELVMKGGKLRDCPFILLFLVSGEPGVLVRS